MDLSIKETIIIKVLKQLEDGIGTITEAIEVLLGAFTNDPIQIGDILAYCGDSIPYTSFLPFIGLGKEEISTTQSQTIQRRKPEKPLPHL